MHKAAGEPLGVEVSSAVFDRIRTCDNHCAFCFIYQLPKGMRRSLYLKDDDYRLSFLYGNFTTLTRFTELDAERVLTERLGPLFVSIHATDPTCAPSMLRNPKGATSLRWLEVLLAGGIEVHGQVVVCPGVNDGEALDDTLAGILDAYPGLASVGVVPLGISRFSNEPTMRAHTRAEAAAVVDRCRPGRRCSSRSWAGTWCTWPMSTTYWRAGRFRRPAPTTATPSSRTGSAWPGPSPPASPAGRRGPRGAPRVLRLGRRARPAAGTAPAPAPRSRR